MARLVTGLRPAQRLGVWAIALLAGGCAAQPSAPPSQRSDASTPAAAAATAAAPLREQALVEDLVVANRILGRELGILDIQGHTTVRSGTNPDRYYIPRFMSPGGMTVGDAIENDLDSRPVGEPRTDQAREIFLHGEIYKARADVNVVVHAHAPEFVAYSMSSVPLIGPNGPVPVWDIRRDNNGRSGIVNTPALGKAMAATLGRHEAVLLWGHGIAFTARTLPEAVVRVNDLRNAARLQMAAIAMGGRPAPGAPGFVPDVEAGRGTTDGSRVAVDRVGRAWTYWKDRVLTASDGRVPQSAPDTPARPADAVTAATRDLALANRMFTLDELGILTSFGHLSVRHPGDAASYLIAPVTAPGAVTPGDVVTKAIGADDLVGEGLGLHAAIYRAKPDVMTVLYAETPEIVAFSQGPASLRPVVNGAAFVAGGVPVVDIGRRSMADPTVGADVARALGRSGIVLIAGRGYVMTDRSIYNLSNRAYQFRLNALIQRQALALRARVEYLDDRPTGPAEANAPGQAGPTGPQEGRHWVYWSSLVSLDD